MGRVDLMRWIVNEPMISPTFGFISTKAESDVTVSAMAGRYRSLEFAA